MKFKPESVLWKIDREYSRWFSVQTHGELGTHTHKVLVTVWKESHLPLFSDVPRWRAKIISPQNTAVSSVFAGRSRKKATQAALHAFERFLYELGMES